MLPIVRRVVARFLTAESASTMARRLKKMKAELKELIRTPDHDREKGKEMLRKIVDLEEELSDARKNERR